jgi:styrene monooxygenase reductase component
MNSSERSVAAGHLPTVDAAQFRKTVALFATGIAVITCDDEDGRVHGMTLNSFTSISVEPPTVLISVKPGKTHRLMSRGGRYGASILDQTQQDYSAHFSGRPQDSFKPDFVVRDRVPTLSQCLAWFECDVTERIQVNDHTLFIGRVTACGGVAGAPLMFFASKYHRPAVAA